MCRMIAKVAVEPSDATYELLDAPHSLLNQSFNGRYSSKTTPFSTHRDGSGVAWVKQGQITIEKTGANDSWSASFQESVKALRTQFLIAHNRKASKGLEIDNRLSHPYPSEVAGRPVAFCHNGGIKNFMQEAKERGVTDSMLFLNYISSHLQRIDTEQLAILLKDCADTWTYSSLNGFLLVGDGLYAWRCFDPARETLTEYERYFTLYRRQNSGHMCVASEKIDGSDDWALLPNRTLLAITLEGNEIRSELKEF